MTLLKQYTNPLLLSHKCLPLEYSDLYCLQIIFEKNKKRKNPTIYKFPYQG